MKKGTKTLAALLIGATFALGLGACQPKQPVNPTPTPEKQTYAVTIANKAALQAEWPANGGGRKVEINVEPKANVAQLVKNGDVVISSNNTAVLNIAGLMAMPVAAGQATITVTSGENSDTVEVEISEALTIKTKYGVEHEGTEDDPLTNEEAITVANHADYNTDGGHEDLYVRGIVSSFYHAPGSRTDGAVSWFLTPAEGQTAKFEIYKCYKQGTGEASYLTDSDVWVGADVLVHGRFTLYNGQAETDGAIYVRAWGTPPAPRTVIESTFAEALTAGKALEDGADTYDYHQFDAYVTKKSGNDYFLTATKNEAITDPKANTIEIYFGNTAPAEAIANKLTKGAKITIKMILKNYHGQVENLLALTADDITVVEAGGTWDVTPEPAVETRTLAQFIAGENTKAKAYNVTAQIKSWKNDTADKDKYGNMVLTDGTNDLTIYGSTATATALAWNDADAYAFSNPQDFLTNPTTSALNKNDTVVMKLIRADYNGAVQGTGIITGVNPGQGGGGEETEGIALTAQSLLGYNGSANVAYDTNYKNATIDGVAFTYQQIGAYKSGFAGMQFRNKLSDSSNGTKSNLYNTAALSSAIKSLELVWNSGKQMYANNNMLKITFDTVATFDSANKEVQMFSSTADVKTYTITPAGTSFTFVKIEIDDAFTYTCYWDSITIK